MNRTCWAGRIAALALIASFCVFCAGCKDDNTGPPPTDGGKDEGPIRKDGPVCKRPPMALCEPPPYGLSCQKYYFCPGCTCTGPTKVAACNPLNNDCRFFCTGCFPDEYVSCSDTTASGKVLARCGFCFIDTKDAGPGRCNVIGPHDGGPG